MDAEVMPARGVWMMHWRNWRWGVSAGALICALGAPVAAQTLVGDGTVTCGTTPYTVASGDTLSLIARRAYGDPQLYGFIAEANWDAIGGNPENISVGMPLTIPCVDASGKVLTAEEAAALAGSVQAAVMAEGPLTPEQLDALFGPVALFPDAVLSRVLVAVTFPLDVVKAGRFIEETAGIPDTERATQARAQPWDASVQELAAAFPDLVTRMNDHIDWTEQAGEAVLAQTDDVLASVQRLRAKAQENGYLVDNPAQNVETVDEHDRHRACTGGRRLRSHLPERGGLHDADHHPARLLLRRLRRRRLGGRAHRGRHHPRRRDHPRRDLR